MDAFLQLVFVKYFLHLLLVVRLSCPEQVRNGALPWLFTTCSFSLLCSLLFRSRCFLRFLCCCCSHSFSSFTLPRVSRTWWTISAKSSSWSWAIWTGARNMAHEAEGECQSGAAEFFPAGHTGVQLSGYLFSHTAIFSKIWSISECWWMLLMFC